jgi:hypothetical protein
MVLQALVVFLTFLCCTVTGFSVADPNKMAKRGNNDWGDVDAATGSASASVLYGVPGSGWTSPTWNWGYAVGTGHDCARICRNKFQSRSSRTQLVRDLLNPANGEDAAAQATDLEELKLVLALAWQRGRWDGSDGGPGGYGEVLSHMAEAVRYELGSAVECRRRLLGDMQSRFATLQPSEAAVQQVASLSPSDEDVDSSLRVCSGLVLQAMGFVERGQ